MLTRCTLAAPQLIRSNSWQERSAATSQNDHISRNRPHNSLSETRQPMSCSDCQQLGVLGLVVNMVVIWNTLYLDRILTDLRTRGTEMQRADVPAALATGM